MHSFSLNVNPCLSCVVLFLFLGLSLTTTSQTCTWDYLGSQAISSGTGEWTDIEYNPVTGEPYVAFQDESLGERITVMKYDGSTWSVVGTAGFSEGQSFNPDLEFDSSGTPYVSYRHFPAFGYSVQMFDGTDWVILGASDFTGDANGNGSLAVDPVSGDLYIAYPDLNSGLANKLTVQRWDGTSWSLVGMQGFTTDGTAYPDIKVDATGTPYVMFTSTNSFALNLQVFGGTFWTTVGTANFSPNSPSSPSYSAALEFNPVTGDPTIVSRVNGNLIDVFTYDGVSWTDDTLPNYGNSGSNQRFGFEFDSAGNIYFAIKRNAGTPVFAASVISNKGGSWDYVGNAVISEDLADYVALALNPSGEPVIAFHDNSPGGGGAISVMEASCAIQGCTDPTACNYNSEATQDDGSCLTVQGCTDPSACNYDASAECEDGSCLLPDGCTDPGAYNYDPAATCDDGSCTDFGSALNFNGIGTNSDYISVPTDASVEFGSGAFTIETWFRMEPANDFSSLLAAYNVSNGGWAFHRDEPENGANNVRWIVGNSASTGNFESIYSGPLNFNEWYHIAGVRDDNELRLYVNGVLVGTTPASRNLPTLPLLLGRRYGDVPQWGHNGDLDEVRLWDRALNEDEINARMNCELNGDEPGLVRYFKLNQGEAFGDNTSITTATSDQLTNPVDGSLVGFELTGAQANFVVGQDLTDPCLPLIEGCMDPAACNYDATAQTDDGSCQLPDGCTDPMAPNYDPAATCDDGSCAEHATGLNMNNDDDRVFLSDLTGFNASEFSMQMMVYLDPTETASGYKTLFHIGNQSSSFLELYTQGSNNVALLFNRNQPGYEYRQYLAPPTDEWVLVSLVFDLDGGPQVFYNGLPAVQTDNIGAWDDIPAVPADGAFYIGHMPSNGWGQCCAPRIIDECRIWNRRLSEQEVGLLGDCEIDGTDPDLFAHYSFNQGGIGIDNTGIDVVIDQTGNGRDGALLNMALNGTSSNWAEGSDLILDVCAALAPGCTDPTACNYDANATSDDGSCQLPDGCTDPLACNYDASAECDNGSCDFVSCQGCTDPSACNYDPTATNDDGTCELPIIIDLGEDQEICSGDEVILDAGAGFLNYLWSTGETTQTITVDSPGSYSVEATYGVGNPVINSQSYETFFNSGRVDIPSWFIPSENTVGGLVEFPLPTNIIGWNTLFGQGGAIHPILIRDDGQLGLFNMATGFGDSGYNVSSLAPGYHQIAAVASGGSTTFYVDGVEVGTTNSVTFGSLTAMGNIISGTQPAGVIDNMFISASALTAEQIEANRCGLDPDSPSMVLYYDFENVSGTSVQDISGNGNNGIIVGGALPTGEDLGCNLGCTSFDEVSITLKPEGCTDPSACNYDANAECDNGSCILPDGCTDNTACNYDPAALCDDGSCDFTSCVGCTDPLADNYEADNTVDDGSCTYCPATLTYNTTIPEPIVIGNGISNDHMAQSANCNVSASIKAIERFVGDIIPTDGLYRVQTGESPVSGIDPTPDPGTARWNYLFSVNLGSFTAEDVKIYLDLDFDPAVGAGSVYTADVSQVLIDNGLGGSSLAQDSQNLGFGFWQLLGDPAILPFDPFANGLYDLTIRVESLAGVELVNAAIQVETFTLGCTNPIACNYDSNATDDDGSCLDILGCTDSGACNYDPAANCDDASCEYTSCLGCTDPTSCDYDPTATIDDGSCLIFPGDACDDGNVYTENDQVQADCGCEGTPIDTDGDGISDEDEINVYGTDPNLQDSDYDGLTDGLEINLAGTNPLDPDSDDDGCGDAESFAGLCPGQEDCIGDFNNDGIVNGADLLTFLGVFGTPCE
ncbi:LamG-like jellyroll fold domain-containing protein [Sanyastnella coralliicola]|uniref:LamG-like jellyroll fold domain-containing protein n=1 Tax=Sanyastnella coralliicola TaxID=3069118 RepID=UPI0027BA4B2B|nr:LamG-like jellyroll fold domain-containing protein [Longitalea sp. SCSIO 12813]